MAGLVSNLTEVLKGQTTLFREIVALSAGKKQSIIANDIETLRTIVAQENEIVPKVLKGDKDRERIMADVATVLNKNYDELTLTTLVQLTQGQPENAALTEAVDEFSAAANEMKQTNDINKLLIENALEYLEYNINMIHSSVSSGPAGYGDILGDDQEPGSFLDTRS